MTPHVEKILGGFHHKLYRWITGKQPRRVRDNRCHYYFLREVMRDDGLEEVMTCIPWILFTVAQYIVMLPVLEMS